jgi:hemerythrin-like metal-binding protein
VEVAVTHLSGLPYEENRMNLPVASPDLENAAKPGEMKLMAWSNHFKTGIELVDTQHRALVDMINQAAPHLALNGESAKRAVGPLLDNLTRYAAVHFRDEEHFMAQKQLTPDYLALHHKSHLAFVDDLTQMRAQYEHEGSLSGTELLRFLTGWLSFHILMEDQRMARQVHEMAAGKTALQAFESLRQTDQGAHAIYSNSLLDLFTLLTERNQRLVQANEEVKKSHLALATANQSLEIRVKERTRDLSDTLTKLQRTQNRLMQSEKLAAVGQLAAGVAHEINNPVGFVTSNVSSLTDYVDQLFALIDQYQAALTSLPAEHRAALEVASKRIDLDYLREDIPSLLKESRDGLNRVKNIVTGLRDFSRADDGQWTPTNLTQVLESSLKIAGNEIKNKATVVNELIELPPVECIASQISQVLVNLMVNAAQAVTSPGVITLRSGVQGESVWLEVSDNGSGMPDEVKMHIFEPFYTTKPVGQGTGLGLSISWEIMQRHQGQIEVTSAPSMGTTFHLTLPIHHTDPSITV